jgi:CBS domain-containing protein
MELLAVDDAMQPVPQPLPDNVPLNEAIARFTEEARDALPVVDAHGHYRGTVTARQVEQSTRDNALDVVVGELARETPTLTADQSLVLAPDGRAIIGWLTHRDVLRAYNERLERSVARAERGRQAARPDERQPPVQLSPLARLRGYRLVELDIQRERGDGRRRIVDIGWPPGALVLALRRDGESFEPTEDTELRRGDRLTVLVPADRVEALARMAGEDLGLGGPR